MYLYGASGHAKVIIDILRANHEPIEALFDDNEEIHCLFDYPVLRPSKVCGPLIISIRITVSSELFVPLLEIWAQIYKKKWKITRKMER